MIEIPEGTNVEATIEFLAELLGLAQSDAERDEILAAGEADKRKTVNEWASSARRDLFPVPAPTEPPQIQTRFVALRGDQVGNVTLRPSSRKGYTPNNEPIIIGGARMEFRKLMCDRKVYEIFGDERQKRKYGTSNAVQSGECYVLLFDAKDQSCCKRPNDRLTPQEWAELVVARPEYQGGRLMTWTDYEELLARAKSEVERQALEKKRLLESRISRRGKLGNAEV